MNNSGIDAIIFDLNGVLVNGEHWHEDAFTRAMGDFGYKVIPGLKKKGYSTTDRLIELSKIGKAPNNIEGILEAKKRYTRDIVAKECKPIGRIVKAVKFAHDFTGGKIAIATNCSEESAMDMLFFSNLLKWFRIIITSSDFNGRKMKPHPRSYLEASYKLGVDSRKCLAIDNSDIGVFAAVRARCKVLKIKDFENMTADLIEKKLKILEIRI